MKDLSIKELRALNESYTRMYDTRSSIDESVYEQYDIDEMSILEEFADDRERGINRMQWNLIDPEQYANALRRFVSEGPELFRFPERIVDDWLQLITENVKIIETISILDGRDELNGGSVIDYYMVEDMFPEEYKTELKKLMKSEASREIPSDTRTRIVAAMNALDSMGFYDWAVMPDGNPADSDNGTIEAKEILDGIEDDTPLADKLVAVNRCMDVFHRRSDWASAFIKGGRASLDAISNDRREIASEYPMDESFENLHPKAVENIVSKQQRDAIVNGLEYDGKSGELHVGQELMMRFIPEALHKYFSTIAGRTDGYSTDSSEIRFRFYMRSNAGISRSFMKWLKDALKKFIDERFGGKFTDFWLDGTEHELNMYMYLKDRKTMDEIRDRILHPRLEQMTLF